MITCNALSKKQKYWELVQLKQLYKRMVSGCPIIIQGAAGKWGNERVKPHMNRRRQPSRILSERAALLLNLLPYAFREHKVDIH